MYLENSFIKRYYFVSLIFAVFSIVDGVTYLLNVVTFVNFVFLLFEFIWLFFSLIIFIYILVEHYQKALLSLPALYLLYFLFSFVYTIMYEKSFMWEYNVEAVSVIDKAVFMRNNGLAIILFSVVAFAVFGIIWKKFFRKIL